jgi:hypothetical protein
MRVEMTQMQRLKTLVTLATLAPASFHITQSIPITIEGSVEEFTATFVEANVSASGETEADALLNFKEVLLSTYEILEGMPAAKLGPIPARQWEILMSVVRRA